MLEIKELPKSEIEITSEISGEEFSKFWPKAVGELSKNVSLPGFRPGKIPEKILVEKVGEGAVLEKAAEMALQDVYPKIVQEKKLEVVGPPRVTITKIAKGSVLGFKFQSAVLPKIKLSENFKRVALDVFKKKEEVKVEDKEIDDSLEYLRKARAKNDQDKVIGLDDDFARSVGDFKTLVELRETLRKNIQTEKEFKLKEKKQLEALDAILEESQMEVPDILIDAEKNKMLQDIKANITNMGLKWEDYLKHIKKEEKELLEGWADDALKKVKYGLLLSQLAKELKIEITESEIESKIKEFKIKDTTKVDQRSLRDYAYGIIRNEKIFQILC